MLIVDIGNDRDLQFIPDLGQDFKPLINPGAAE